MKILLFKNDRINTFELPSKVSGNIWISTIDENGNSKNMINVEATPANEWQLVSNDDFYAIVDSKKQAGVILKENAFFMIKEAFSDSVMYIYCCSNYDKTIKYYSASTPLITGITIGKSENCKIKYNCHYTADNHAQILLKGDNIIITDLNSNFGTYVNNIKIKESTILNYGDVVFIAGLRIILLKVNGTHIIGIGNPNDLVTTSLTEYNIQDKNNESFDEPLEEKDFQIYSADDYFHKKPRFMYKIEEKIIGVDAPPNSQHNQKMPLIMTVGPMMTMSITSAVMCFTTISSINSGERTLEESLSSLVSSIVMMLTFILWPLITNLFQRHMEKSTEKKRQKKYSEYIEQKKKEILEEKKNQEEILRRKYPSLKECEEIIINKKDRLWERRVEDDDFLNVSLGIGSFPMKLSLKIPDEHFSLESDILKIKLKELSKTEKNLSEVPFEYSFMENTISAIIGPDKIRNNLIKNIILQLITFHSYDNLKIAIFTSKEKEYLWNDIKILPHIFNDDKSIRYFSACSEEYKELSYNLEREFSKRKEALEETTSNKKEPYNTYYLIITDSFSSVRNIEFINNIVNQKENLGFSTLILTDKMASLPNQCQSFIELSEDVSHVNKNVFSNEENSFKVDMENIDYYKCIKTLCNIPLEINNSSDGSIPKKVGFLEMYDIGKVEQFNSVSRWKKNVPLSNMNAIVGIGKSGEKIGLDLHEKFHGPHGLIAGMTGSGKSEFIITYILSLAVNYHPYEVQFILIDYKGGGLAGAFENQSLGYKLPHLVGVITNLDKTEINRSLSSIESELKRRQTLFNKARDVSGESTIDIYKYQKLYRNNVVKEPVSHLLIIADEFAELKTQQPEFMEQLISTARIGRSLGVHLILATQKPSGIVDAQIWSNTRFRVCFRVQEKSDSVEVIKCPDAAFLTRTGRFYLQVGYNEIFDLGQSAWAGGKYIPSESIRKTIDSSINFINNYGYSIKNIETKEEIMTLADDNKGEELINIVEYIQKCAEEENIKTRPLWLPKIPAKIKIADLIKKYKFEKEKYVLNPVIGEYDMPNKQEQHLFTLPLNKGNTVIYGMAGSGKENFITTMIYSSMLTYTPEEVNYYILDFGAEILRYFDNSPIVGDIIYLSEEEKLKNLFKKIYDTIALRKKLFADYNGDYITYCKNSNNPCESIVIVINNYEAYYETYQDDADKLVELTRDCIKYGIYFFIACNTAEGMRFKLKQNFGNIYALQQNNEDDYITIFGNVHKTFPSKIFGRGILKLDNIYEFQTAIVSDSIRDTVKNLGEKLSNIYTKKAPKIPILPEVVSYEKIKDNVKENEIAIGIEKNSLDTSIIDFTKDHVYLVTSSDFLLFEKFVNPFFKQYTFKNNINTIVINAEDLSVEDSIKNEIYYYDKDFDLIFEKLIDYLNEKIELFKNNNFNKDIFKNENKTTCIIIGINSLKNKLKSENQTKFGDLFNIGSDLELVNFILIDTVDKFKNFQYETWYKGNVNAADGIFIGSDISDQFVISVTKRTMDMKQEHDSNFCYVVKRGKPILVKFIEEI